MARMRIAEIKKRDFFGIFFTSFSLRCGSLDAGVCDELTVAQE